METFFIMLALGVFFSPLILAIIALVKVSRLRQEVGQLQNQVLMAARAATLHPQPVTVVETSAAHRADVPVPRSQSATVKPPPLPQVVPTGVSPVSSVPVETFAKPSKPKMEFIMGGKAAALAGIAILVAGIALLVGYAIQHTWIGPGTRVILGLLAGGVLVGIGHAAAVKDKKYRLLARVLTGGGSALFYFTVFAAYRFYDLIGPVAAGAGLVASALAVFGLAMVYQSQLVAVLGVLGAFITPLLIGGDLDSGLFPVIYVALVNVPVILLGVRRRWQWLYNLAFVFTVIQYLLWFDWASGRDYATGIGFALLFFMEYATLGLLKLRCEQKVGGRTLDHIRLVAASLFLLVAVYWLMDDADMNEWIGTAFLLLALLHAGLAALAFRMLTRFRNEILSFLAGGLMFAVLALPAQLDGVWVSLGWALEGVALAWFAVRVRSSALQLVAVLLGIIGILKAHVFDFTFYPNPPDLFLNVRFAVGMVSALLLGVQGWMVGRLPTDGTEARVSFRNLIWCGALLSLLLALFGDAFWTLGVKEPFCWLITSLMLMAVASAVVLFVPSRSSLTILGSVLLLAVPIKLLVFDAWIGMELTPYELRPFFGWMIWVELALAGMLFTLFPKRIRAGEDRCLFSPEQMARTVNIMSLVAAIGMVTLEISRLSNDWASVAITIFWAVCALVLILFGMKRHVAAHRYMGLVLFALASLKVLLFDSSELRGLERIAALIGTGVLLLFLSFVYQKTAAYFSGREEE